MPEWAVILLICGLYLVLVLGLGVWSGRTVSKSVTGYVAGDRTLGVIVRPDHTPSPSTRTR